MQAGLRRFVSGGAWELDCDYLGRIGDLVRLIQRSREQDGRDQARTRVDGAVPFWIELLEGWKLHCVSKVGGNPAARAVVIHTGCGVRSEQGLGHTENERARQARPRGRGGLCRRCKAWAVRHDVKVPRGVRSRRQGRT